MIVSLNSLTKRITRRNPTQFYLKQTRGKTTVEKTRRNIFYCNNVKIVFSLYLLCYRQPTDLGIIFVRIAEVPLNWGK